MTAQCKRVFSCAKLAKQRKCSWKFKGSLNQNCKKKLPYGQQNALVKNYCRKSCQNCVGTFSVLKEMQICFAILLTTHTLLFLRNQLIFIAPRGLKRRVANAIHEDSIPMDGNVDNNDYGNCMQINIFGIFLKYTL